MKVIEDLITNHEQKPDGNKETLDKVKKLINSCKEAKLSFDEFDESKEENYTNLSKTIDQLIPTSGEENKDTLDKVKERI